MAETLNVSPEPANLRHLTPGEALVDFPFGIASIVNVGDVYYGTIKSPGFLDKQTRGWRGDGGHEVEDIDFAMTLPKHPRPGPIPVVIFGHGLVTERRFVLALGDAIAAKGYAAISIDFPYHGNRTYCATGGPISLVNPLTGALQSLDPCSNGYRCNDEGRCVDAAGQGNHLRTFGVISTPVASGAVFNELDHIAHSKDHFQQALVDLGALDRALRRGDWQAAIGHELDANAIYYSGQSLGGIMGGLFLGTDPAIERAVLNVPGAGLVDLFNDSTFFAAQMDAFFTRLAVDRDSAEGVRLFNVAKWFLDAVDPQHLGPTIANRRLLLQMATLDFIIPNANTKVLEHVTHAPRRDYLAEHGFLVIPLELEYLRGTRDLAKWLAGEDL
jgi:dienelactone hydrolase